MTKLDSNTKFIIIFNYFFVGLIGILIAYLFLKDKLIWFVAISLAIGFLIFNMVKKTRRTTFDLYFDSDYLYLKNKISSKKIKLKKVTDIQYLSTRIRIFGLPFYRYRISYVDQHGANKILRFWKEISDEKMEKFERALNLAKKDL